MKLPALSSRSFCRLKRLSLSYLELDRCFSELLCSSCSVLEDLELLHCFNYFRDITSATLKKLVLYSYDHLDDAGYPMVITAPSLESLKLVIERGCNQDGILCITSSLVESSVCILDDFFQAKDRRRLLGGLSNVTSLELTYFETLAMINENPNEFPVFPNMRTLSLDRCLLDDECSMGSKLDDLGSFLENAPPLEKLTLWCCMFRADTWCTERKSITLQRQDGKTLQCPKLKLVEVMYDNDCEHLLLELMMGITKRLPDASIRVTNI